MTSETKKKTLLRKVPGIIGYFLIFLIFIYFIINALFPKYTIRIFRIQHFLVAPGSTSMEPLINPNDIIIIKRVDVRNIGEGDIISFYVDADGDGVIDIVTHHFYKIVFDENGNEYVLTKGNRTDTPDAWKIERKNIIGKYVIKIPRGGKLLLFLRSPYGIVIIVLGIATIYAMIHLLKKKTNDLRG